MGRIYDVNPGPGELQGRRKVEIYVGGECVGWDGWAHLHFVTRIEFDDDTDEGDATVTTWKNMDGVPWQEPVTRDPELTTFRARVRFAAKNEADTPILVEA